MTGDALTLAVRHATTSVRLTVLVEQATTMVGGMRDIHDNDEELAPELSTALGKLNECVQALRRAHDFSKARLEVAMRDE